jgi:CheY-like chemotaxis protein
MKTLIAEDDPVSRRVAEGLFLKWGYEVVLAQDGNEAWEVLEREDAPRLAVLDWMMPGLAGTDICKRVRGREGRPLRVYPVADGEGAEEGSAGRHGCGCG